MDEKPIKRRGLLLVLSSPSGAGKTTLSRLLIESDPDISMSVSATTRAPRPGEEEGLHYFFVSPDQFERSRDQGDYLEHAEVFGHYYATPKAPVDAALAEGRDVLFDIDWQGTQQLSEARRGDVVRVFILPPSGAELERRLRMRAQDSEDVVRKRMSKAESEISHWAEYDYVVTNFNVDAALSQIRSILAAERLRRERQPGLSAFVKTLFPGSE